MIRYLGSQFASRVLWVVGWFIAILTPIVALYAEVSCEDVFSETCSSGDQIALLFVVLIAGWIYAALILSIAYIVMLLSDIEVNTRDR